MALKYVAIFDSVFVMIDKNCSILPFCLVHSKLQGVLSLISGRNCDVSTSFEWSSEPTV